MELQRGQKAREPGSGTERVEVRMTAAPLTPEEERDTRSMDIVQGKRLAGIWATLDEVRVSEKELIEAGMALGLEIAQARARIAELERRDSLKRLDADEDYWRYPGDVGPQRLPDEPQP